VDASYLSGHPVDDVLAALGKSRSDAVAVFRDAADGSGTMGAVAVRDVDGVTLLHAVTAHWRSAAVTGRSETDVDGKHVWLLSERLGYLVAAYVRTDVVYIVSANDLTTLEALLRSMP